MTPPGDSTATPAPAATTVDTLDPRRLAVLCVLRDFEAVATGDLHTWVARAGKSMEHVAADPREYIRCTLFTATTLLLRRTAGQPLNAAQAQELVDHVLGQACLVSPTVTPDVLITSAAMLQGEAGAAALPIPLHLEAARAVGGWAMLSTGDQWHTTLELALESYLLL